MLEESIFDYKTTVLHSQFAHRGVVFWGLGWIFFGGGNSSYVINAHCENIQNPDNLTISSMYLSKYKVSMLFPILLYLFLRYKQGPW